MAKTKKTDLRKLPLAKRPDPTTGQSAEEFTLAFDGLALNEVKVLKALDAPGAGRRLVKPVADLAKTTRLTPLQTRNAIRRLVPSGWVEHVATTLDDDGEEVEVRGHYRIAEAGRKRLATALD
jgi:hypothetical protein